LRTLYGGMIVYNYYVIEVRCIDTIDEGYIMSIYNWSIIVFICGNCPSQQPGNYTSQDSTRGK